MLRRFGTHGIVAALLLTGLLSCGTDEYPLLGQTVLMPQPFPDLFRTLQMVEDEPLTFRPAEPQVLQVFDVSPGGWRLNARFGEPDKGYFRMISAAALQPAAGLVTEGNSLVGLPAGAALQLVPAPDYWGAITFRVELTHPDLDGTFSATLSASVAPVNDAPRPLPDLYLAREDDPQPLRFDPLANDREVDGDALRLYSLDPTMPTPLRLQTTDRNGHALRCSETGECVFETAADVTADAHFVYWVTDGTVAVSETIFVNLSPQADRPVAYAGWATGPEDVTLCTTLRGSDADGDRVYFELSATDMARPDLTLQPATGWLCWQPPADYVGAITVTILAFDGGWYSAPVSYVLEVTNVPDPPHILRQVIRGAEDVPVTATILAYDPDGDPFTFALIGANGGATRGTVLDFDPATGRIVYLGDEDWFGVDRIIVSAMDHGGLAGSPVRVSIVLGGKDDGLKAYDTTAAGREDEYFEFEIAGDNPDEPGLQRPTYFFGGELIPPPSWLYCDESGHCRGTPPPNWHGTVTFETRAEDNKKNRATITATILPVNDAPAVAPLALTTAEDVARAVSLPVTDVDGDALTYGVLTAPTLGRLVWTSAHAFAYQPVTNLHGTDTFWLTVSDGVLSGAPVPVTIIVQPVNDPIPPAWGLPVPGGVTQVVVIEDGRWLWSLPLMAIDPDGPPAFRVVTPPSRGAAIVTQDGERVWVSYTPGKNVDTSDVFVLGAADEAGEQPLQFAVTVQPVNDAPTCRGGTYYRYEDAAALTIPLRPLAQDVDDAVETLRFSLASSSGGGCKLVDRTRAATPALECQNIANANGAVYARYRVEDPAGARSGDCTVRITTRAVDDPPTASLTSFSTDEDTPTSTTLTLSDVDSSSLRVTVWSSSLVNAGFSNAYFSPGSHKITLTPKTNAWGSASIKFQVRDGSNTIYVSASGTIRSVNDADTLQNVTVSDICNNTRTAAGKDSYTTRTLTSYLRVSNNDSAGSGPATCDFGTPSISLKSWTGRWSDWFGGAPPLSISFGTWSKLYGATCEIPVYVKWTNLTTSRGADDACDASDGSKDASFTWKVTVLDGASASSNRRTISSTLTVSTRYADDWND